jgi:putative FmdB family regulatory protein
MHEDFTMPIYEYYCESCGHQLEALQKMSEEPLKECPECHQSTLNKLVSATSFQLKGTGWYVTDFRDKGKAKTQEAVKPSPSEKQNSDQKSSEGSSQKSQDNSGSQSSGEASS